MEIRRLIDVTRRWAILVVAASVTAGVVAFLVSAGLPKEYSSEARVMVGSLTEPTYDQQLAYQQLAQTYAEVATTTPVLSRVSDQLGLGDPTRLASRLEVRAPLGQSIVRISASAPSPADAMQLANAVAEQITALSRPATGGSSLASVIQPALLPERPSAPLVLLNTLVATLLGLALGLGLALLLAERVPGLHVAVPEALRAQWALWRRLARVRSPAGETPAAGGIQASAVSPATGPSVPVPPLASRRSPAAARLQAVEPQPRRAASRLVKETKPRAAAPSTRPSRAKAKATSDSVPSGRRRARSTIGLDPLETVPQTGEPRRTSDALVRSLEAVKTRRPA